MADIIKCENPDKEIESIDFVPDKDLAATELFTLAGKAIVVIAGYVILTHFNKK